MGQKIVCVVSLVMLLQLFLGVKGDPMVPCYFIFGDSLVDNGNNNNIASLAKANFLPYGEDFPQGLTGRFSNGRTTIDVISDLLGFENYIPPYAQVGGQQVLGGVNYASAAAGIRAETGRQLGGRISFGAQVRNYQNTVSQIVQILGGENQAAAYLSKCIYSVGLGSNDYLNNYFMPTVYGTSRRYTPQQYSQVLLQQYAQQITTLYNYGARKIVLNGIGQVGCSSSKLAERSPDGRTCDETINSANRIFNSGLRSLVDKLNNQFSDARFIYINVYDMFQDLINNPSAFGFTNTNSGCCGVGKNNGQITCLPFLPTCMNRNQFIFWDAFHPGDAANVIIGRRSFRSQKPTDSYPFDIERLAQI